MNFGDERLPARLWEKISPCPMTGCWLWTATFAGAPQIRWKTSDGWKVVAVRRVIAELLAGKTLDCGSGIGSDCKDCVNPNHYRFGTTAELSKEWSEQHPMLFCKHGHERAVVGTYPKKHPDGRVSHDCRTCHALRLQKFNDRKRRQRVSRMGPSRRAEFERRSAAQREIWRSGKKRRHDGSITPLAVVVR